MTRVDASLAFVFPGQGSQSIGMLAELGRIHSVVKTTFDEASQGVGMDLWQLAQQGPQERLDDTRNTQPTLLAASVAVWRVWQVLGGYRPARLAGHSLGEYSALVCAGALSVHDAAMLVAQRGCLMQTAVPTGAGAMAAIMGADEAQVTQVCHLVSGHQVVSVANFNSPRQQVIAGHVEAVDRALKKLASLGIKKVVRLAVSVPSHCSLMCEAAEQLGEHLAAVAWQMPSIPVVQNVDARSYDSLEEIRSALQRQLYQPVRWIQCVRTLVAEGASRLVECGPNNVLTGLVRQIDRQIEIRAISIPAELEATLAHCCS